LFPAPGFAAGADLAALANAGVAGEHPLLAERRPMIFFYFDQTSGDG